MNLIELQDHARSLVFAMEMGAPAATVLEGVQRMVNDLGGKLDVRRPAGLDRLNLARVAVDRELTDAMFFAQLAAPGFAYTRTETA